MYTSIIQHLGRNITLRFSECCSNEGRLCVEEVDINGKDCSRILSIGNMTGYFEDLILNEKR